MNLYCNFDVEYSKRLLYANLSKLSGEYSLDVRKKKDKRSVAFNRYYWGVVLKMIVEEVQGVDDGIDKDRMHEIMKYTFLKEEYANPVTGEIVVSMKDTHDMPTEDFKRYVESVRGWAYSFLGIVIPLPDEVEY